MGGHSDLVEFFIERNSCQSGELALVQKLESLNLFSPDDMTKSGAGILHFTCRSVNNKSVELFKYLLHRYLYSIDVKDSKYGRTPLHFASWFALSSVVEYIVSIQAIHIPAGIVYSKLIAQSDSSFIDIINRTRIKTKVDFSKRNERVKMFSSIIKKASTCPNFDINATTNDLHYVAWSGSTSVLSYIISQYNLNANDTDTYGRTPLVYSSCDPNITDKYGMTCLHHSCRHGHIDITQYLIE
ncbi:PREDICTED: inversin-like, partial [Amphimedon queenslandica]|uniref:Uncharacterized protein n=1 Tax=Amphimedon queenslandica TaxID=400682 RepID=A0AAN0K0Z1_AMPQE